MWFFWLFALVPILFGVVSLYFDRRITWQEVLGSTGVALLMAGLFQLIACIGMTSDIETWSGYGTQARQFSAWKEYYEYAVYRTEYYEEEETYTDSKGNTHTQTVTHSRQVFDHWEPTTRWHDAYWTLYTTIDDFNISEEKFTYMCQKYNDRHAVEGSRTTWEHNSKMIDGDPNDYIADNHTGWIEPATTTKHFVNRIKAAPSLFSFAKVPTNIAVYSWPENPDWNTSQRVMGTAVSMIDTLKWDQMNAVLGPMKKINLIIVGFPSGQSMDMAKWQEAKWIGGKKNDLVICYAGGNQTTHAEWAYVFGWSEKTLAKLNIQDILTENPINSDIITKISREVQIHYEKKDWHKFDYIKIEPPTWSYWVYILTMVLVQGGLYFWFNVNEFDNEDFDKKVDYKGAEEAFIDKLLRKWNFLVGQLKVFFIKPKPEVEPAPIQSYTEYGRITDRRRRNRRLDR